MGIYIDSQCYLPLFRARDPDTSKAAGRAARETGLVGRHEQLILAALEQGPAGKCGIAARCGLTEQQVNRRLASMRSRGLVERTGNAVLSDSRCHEHEYRILTETPAST